MTYVYLDHFYNIFGKLIFLNDYKYVFRSKLSVKDLESCEYISIAIQ